MRLIVSDIPEEGLNDEFDLLIDTGLRRDSAHADLKVRRLGDRIFIDGSARMNMRLLCSRCLAEFRSPLNVRFSEEYIPVPEESAERDHEAAVSDQGASCYNDDEIDVDALIREQLLLAVPMKPLCKTECPGLCSRCGMVLDEGVCGCRNDGMDPRWSPLRKIKNTLKQRKE